MWITIITMMYVVLTAFALWGVYWGVRMLLAYRKLRILQRKIAQCEKEIENLEIELAELQSEQERLLASPYYQLI